LIRQQRRSFNDRGLAHLQRGELDQVINHLILGIALDPSRA